ncbi:hypothetical protein [Dyella flagellata]|nr:hypothetical protein [Dyella flagellata]
MFDPKLHELMPMVTSARIRHHDGKALEHTPAYSGKPRRSEVSRGRLA